MCIRDRGTITALLQSLETIPSINALLHNFKIQSITILPPFLIISPVISSISEDLPFFNFLTLPIFLLFANNLIPKIPIPSCTIKPTHSHYHLIITANIIQIFRVFFPHSTHINFISYKNTIPIHYSKQVPLILILNFSRFLPEELPISLYVPIHPPSKLFIYLSVSYTHLTLPTSDLV